MKAETIVSPADLVRCALSEVDSYARTIAGNEESPAMVGYAGYGIAWNSAACEEPDGLRDIEMYRKLVSADHLSAWMDNTTILTSNVLMSDEAADFMTPLTIWDLATFARAVVCYERIYHHWHPRIADSEINNALGGEVLINVPLPTRGGDPLPHPWHGAHRFMCNMWFESVHWLKRLHQSVGEATLDGQQIEAVTQAWRAALGRSDLRSTELVDFNGVDRRWRSPSDRLLMETADVEDLDSPKFIEADDVGDRTARARRDMNLPDPFPEIRSNLLSDLNLRSYVNQRLAEFFALPYACSLARTPFRRQLYNRSIAIENELRVAKIIDDRYAELNQAAQLRLPIFLALLLRESGSPQDLWKSLAALRRQASTFRAHRQEMDRELARGNLKELTSLSRSLHSSVDDLVKIAGKATTAATTVVFESLSKGDIPGVGTGISATVAAVRGVLKSSFAERLIWRIRRPQLLWVNNIVDQAEQLTEAMPDFSRIWRIPMNRQTVFAERFMRMKALGS